MLSTSGEACCCATTCSTSYAPPPPPPPHLAAYSCVSRFCLVILHKSFRRCLLCCVQCAINPAPVYDYSCLLQSNHGERTSLRGAPRTAFVCVGTCVCAETEIPRATSTTYCCCTNGIDCLFCSCYFACINIPTKVTGAQQ